MNIRWRANAQVALAVVAAAIPTAAIPRTYAPSQIVSVLVDLSRTWHNPASRGYNSQVLRNVGRAVADAAQKMPKPVAVRHHIIGTASLARPPICSIMYRPSLIGFGDAENGVEPNGKKFAEYVGTRCPQFVLSQPEEPTTEITAAIITALQTNAMAAASVPRVMIILSDFKEESQVRYRLGRNSLRGVRVILLWRTLPEDRRSQSGLTRRIQAWRRMVTGHGGQVMAFADSAVMASPAELRAMIEGR